MTTYEQTRLNKVRKSDRAVYEREAIHAILDEGFVTHAGFIFEERPTVIPMIYGRDGDTLYIHGAKAARFAKAMAPGIPVCLTVTLVDGIVVARSAFHMSMNYRSVVLHGHAVLVTDPEEAVRALTAITDHALPGRWEEVRPMIEKEFRATSILRVDVEAASLKSRSGPPIDEDEDYGLPLWAGVLPLKVVAGSPVDDGQVAAEAEIPVSVRHLMARLT